MGNVAPAHSIATHLPEDNDLCSDAVEQAEIGATIAASFVKPEPLFKLGVQSTVAATSIGAASAPSGGLPLSSEVADLERRLGAQIAAQNISIAAQGSAITGLTSTVCEIKKSSEGLTKLSEENKASTDKLHAMLERFMRKNGVNSDTEVSEAEANRKPPGRSRSRGGGDKGKV